MAIRALSLFVRAVAFIIIVAPALATAAEPKQVLVLHSFGREFKPWSEYAKAIRLELERQSLWPLDIQELRSTPDTRHLASDDALSPSRTGSVSRQDYQVPETS